MLIWIDSLFPFHGNPKEIWVPCLQLSNDNHPVRKILILFPFCDDCELISWSFLFSQKHFGYISRHVNFQMQSLKRKKTWQLIIFFKISKFLLRMSEVLLYTFLFYFILNYFNFNLFKKIFYTLNSDGNSQKQKYKNYFHSLKRY